MEANFASRVRSDLPVPRSMYDVTANVQEVDFSADELKEIRGIIDAHETAGERYGPAMIAHVGK